MRAGEVDEQPERLGRARQAGRVVRRVEVEDDAGPRFAGPGEDRLLVALDEPDRAVDDERVAVAERLDGVGHERGQPRARDVQLGDDLAAGNGRPEVRVERRVVARDVLAPLVEVRPVELARGRGVVRDVGLGRRGAVGVGEVEQPAPVHPRQRSLAVGDRGRGLVRAVAREDADAEEVGRALVDRELAVAEEEAVGDPLVEPLDELVDRRQRHDPAEDLPRRQPQADRGHDAEQSVAADDEAEQLGVARPADLADLARRVDQRERLDVGADRTLGQAAPVDVGGERATERQVVGAGLLLADAPGARVIDVIAPGARGGRR